jgi:hypothetical protein
MRTSQRSRAKYPLATISAYGPDNERATKLVVGILRRPGQQAPHPMGSWNTDTIDVMGAGIQPFRLNESYIRGRAALEVA